MRHRKRRNQLSRDYDHRRAVVKNLVRSFFLQGKIQSTRPKIILAQRLVERLVSRGKKGGLNARRYLFRYWQDQHFVNRLAAMFQGLKGTSGFTRIRPSKIRRGDRSLLYILEFSQPIKLEKAKEKGKAAGKAEKAAKNRGKKGKETAAKADKQEVKKKKVNQP